MPPRSFIAEHFGKATGSVGGIAGFHAAEPEIGIMGGAGTIGSQFPVSLGWGLAAKKKGKGQVVVCFFGDGSSNRGTLHDYLAGSTIPGIFGVDTRAITRKLRSYGVMMGMITEKNPEEALAKLKK